MPVPREALPAGPVGAAAPGGVIHDIGYRNYDGARLGRAYILRSLYVQSLRSTYGLGRSAKSKVLPFLLAGAMLLPAVIVVAVMMFARLQDLPLPYERYFVVTQAVIGIFVASQAPQLFSRDLRFRTITLYFSRPLTRLDYVTAKFAALATSIAILVLAPLIVLYAGTLLAKLSFGEQTKNFAAGLAGVVVLALVLAGVGGVIASLTTRRGFGVAAIITVLVLSYSGVTIASGIAQSENNTTLAGYFGLLSPITLVDGVQVTAFGAEYSGVIPPPDTTVGLLAFVLTAAAVVVGSFGLLLLRYRTVANA
ncbi:ABC transporter permease [Actinopolymorpha sp. B11F2]|uniref:ABC transporter permease n=1 Tax=Actinopolymorpha sp. B11F2 TaxID=3160862 RepID=UPI0032E39AA4